MRYENTLEAEFVFPKEIKLKIAEQEFSRIIVREVNGFDEEIISQPRYKDNPAKMFQELISRCIAEVPGSEGYPTKKELKDLPVGILDEIILKIRQLSVGDEFSVKAVCPIENCRKPEELIGSLDLIKRRKGSYAPKKIKLQRGVVFEGKKLNTALIKPPDGHMQEDLIGIKEGELVKFGELSTGIIFSCLVSIDDIKPSREMVTSMVRVDRKLLSEEIQNFPGPETVGDVACKSCGYEYEQQIPILDFLF
jgi:hypothetical protein